MLKSIKAKFVLSFGTLIVVLFSAVGVFLVDAKAQELSEDIADTTIAFSQLTVGKIMGAYGQYLEPGNFVLFRREIAGDLRSNKEVSSVEIASYSGVILYDSATEIDEQYDGVIRTVLEEETLDRVQANNMSVLLDDGEVIYLLYDEDKNFSYVDVNENEVEPLSARDRVVDIVVPYENNAYSVFYKVNYDSMEERLAAAKLQIVIMATVGVALALMISFMLSVSITNPLKDLKAGALKIAKGDFGVRVPVRTKDEVGVLAGTFNQMAADLAASTEAIIYKERVGKELELAAQIQADLLPKEEMQTANVDVSGGLVAATEIGGDAFDYIQMKDSRYLVYLGDVTGHGVAAGIISSVANAMLYGLRSEPELRTLVSYLNEVMVKKTSARVFMTMALTMWNDQTSELSYINAGHLPVLYYDSAQQKVTEIKIPGIALGLSGDLKDKFEEFKVQMKPNDVLVMYSDGITEAVGKSGEQYGMAKLKRIVQDAAGDLYTAKGIKNAVLSDVVEYIGDKDHADDMTVVVLKRKGV